MSTRYYRKWKINAKLFLTLNFYGSIMLERYKDLIDRESLNYTNVSINRGGI